MWKKWEVLKSGMRTRNIALRHICKEIKERYSRIWCQPEYAILAKINKPGDTKFTCLAYLVPFFVEKLQNYKLP